VARRAIVIAASFWVGACATVSARSVPPAAPDQLAVAEGWTRTPLDPVLASLRCDGENCELCRVRVHVVEPSAARREVEHRLAGGARMTFVMRTDTTASGRGEIVREGQRLAASIELGESAAVVDPNELLRWLTEPAGAPAGARATRSYEARVADTSYWLSEWGSARREGRLEREERDDGVEQRSRLRAPRYEADAWATREVGRRRTVTGYAADERAWGDHETNEELDQNGLVVRRTGPSGATRAEHEYDESGNPIAVRLPGRDGRTDRVDLVRSDGLPAVLARDGQGRPTSVRFGDNPPVSIERDDVRRTLRVTEGDHTRTQESDSSGRLVRELIEVGDWSRSYVRRYDELGRLIASEVVEHGGWRSGEGDLVTRATLEYSDRCGPAVAVPDELDLLPAVDARVDWTTR